MKTPRHIILCGLLLIHTAMAGGSISWDHAKAKIAHNDPGLTKIIDAEFIVNRVGSGVRLGPHFGDRQGERIAPFTFSAQNRKTGEKVILIIEESDDFAFTSRFKFTWRQPAEGE